MHEFEIRLAVPTAQAAAVESALRQAGARSQRLRATYYDTAGEALDAAHVALRVRQEGRRWVQTLKAPGRHPLERLEHNVALDAVPAVADPSLHRRTPAGRALARVLPTDAALQPFFRTDIQRLAVSVAVGGSEVEIAFDRGTLAAGRRRLAVSELEFECLAGDPADALRLARRWQATHGLWIDVRSKSQRGRQLARGRPADATGAEPLCWRPGQDFGHALLANTLAQVLGNAAEIAAGTVARATATGCAEAPPPEAVHELRIGLRRLRTALRELPDLMPAVPERIHAELRHAFRALGAQRDRACLVPALMAAQRLAGAPAFEWQAAAPPDPAAVVTSPGLQEALLALLAASAQPGTARPRHALRATVAKALRHLLRRLRRDAHDYARLDALARHTLRKRLKRLRDLGEMTAPLFPRHAVLREARAAKAALDVLGELQDTLAALRLWQGQAAQSPAALWGVGWLSARAQVLGEQATSACVAWRGAARAYWD